MPERPYGLWRLWATKIAMASMGHGAFFFFVLKKLLWRQWAMEHAFLKLYTVE